MKKHIISLMIGLMNSHGLGDLEKLEIKAFDSYFDINKWAERKEGFKKDLLNGKINDAVVFNDRRFVDLDFSGLDFRNRSFSYCIFQRVNFDNTDLRGATFEECCFIGGRLWGALLYTPHDLSQEDIWLRGLVFFKYRNSCELLEAYSCFVKMSKRDKKIDKYSEYCKCFNKLFPCLWLYLGDGNLKDLDLTGVNLRNANLIKADLKDSNLTGADFQDANLTGAGLQGSKLIRCDLRNSELKDAKFQRAWITDSIQVPDYLENDKTELFEKWIKSSFEEEFFYQMLVSGRFNILIGVNIELVREGLRSKKNLRKAYFNGAQLEEVDLSHADLYEANLVGSNLKNANLSYANLQHASLWDVELKGSSLIGTQLGGTKLSGTFSLPENCQDKDLYKIYESCNDVNAKSILKEIIIAKGL